MFPVTIFTDHNPLVFVNKMKNKNQRLVRWNLCYQEYKLNIQHFGDEIANMIADALSKMDH